MSTTYKTVLCHGVFDVLHPGHLEHLRAARALGDKLVVSVTADKHVNKGPGRPILSQQQRADMLGALKFVDSVIITDSESAVPAINVIKPAVYAKGWEYKTRDVAGNLMAEKAAVEAHGGTLAFTDRPAMSSSAIINSLLPRVADDYLKRLRTLVRFADVESAFEKVRGLSITAAGERIQDVYVYVAPAQKAPKDNLVTFIDQRTERWEGGISVIAANMAGYVKHVKVADGNAASLVKRRFVDSPFGQKVFHDVIVPPAGVAEPLDIRGPLVAADFGHGLWPTEASTNETVQQATWVGLTVQSNSLNWGFNLVSKWPSADYVVIDRAEAQLAIHERADALIAIKRVKSMLKAKIAVVTAGHEGCYVVTDKREFNIPALSTIAVDRMGAGDAFLAWSAPFVYADVDSEVSMFIASCAAAIKVSKQGNPPLSKAEVMGMAKAVLA